MSTVFDASIGDLVNRGTIPSTSAVAALRGGKQLEPESSTSFAGGIVYERDAWRFTADYFRISISDRFAQTSTFSLTPAEVDQLVAEGITSAANLQSEGHSRNHATATDGNDRVRHRWALLQDLQRDGALPGDDGLVIIRMDHDQSLFGLHAPRLDHGLGECVAQKGDLGPVTTGVGHLDERRRDRDDHGRRNSQTRRVIGNSLRVIARARRDDSSRALALA